MTEANVKGMLTIAELQDLVDADQIETIITAFPDHYGRLVGKRIDPEFFIERIADDGMHACDYLLTTDMDMNPVPGYGFANWEKGYGDVHCVPDMGSLRLATWLEKTAIVLCDIVDDRHELLDIAPRSLLKRQIANADNLGYAAVGASELEYYIFNTGYREARQSGYRDLEAAGDYIEDYHILQGTREEAINAAARKHLSQSGVPVEFSKGEAGPGQHELNIRYADLLSMADRHLMYKQCFKEIADSQGKSVTFMAKFETDLAGSSCHMHVSLWDRERTQNLFSTNSQSDRNKATDTFRHFLGGWMHHVNDLMVFYAPTVNSYKRFVAESWAPTSIAWSYDNRTTGFRIVGSGNSLRIESRIAGADVNPYLAYAAVLASGIDGIVNKIEPPEEFTGDGYTACDVPQVTRSFSDAISRFKVSSFARRAFGDDVIDHYSHFYEVERGQYRAAVTDWERARYFEQI